MRVLRVSDCGRSSGWLGFDDARHYFIVQRVVPTLIKANSGTCLMGLLGIVVAVVSWGRLVLKLCYLMASPNIDGGGGGGWRRLNKWCRYGGGYGCCDSRLLIKIDCFDHWLMDWLVDWRVDWSIDWLVDGLIDFSIDWLVDRLIDWLIDWPIDWLIHWSIDWLIGWSIDCLILIGWLIEWLDGWLIDCLILTGWLIVWF